MTTDQRKEADKPAEGAKAGASVHGGYASCNQKPVRDETRGRGIADGQTFSGRRPDGSIWGADGMCLSPALDSQSGRDLVAYYDRPGANTGD